MPMRGRACPGLLIFIGRRIAYRVRREVDDGIPDVAAIVELQHWLLRFRPPGMSAELIPIPVVAESGRGES